MNMKTSKTTTYTPHMAKVERKGATWGMRPRYVPCNEEGLDRSSSLTPSNETFKIAHVPRTAWHGLDELGKTVKTEGRSDLSATA